MFITAKTALATLMIIASINAFAEIENSSQQSSFFSKKQKYDGDGVELYNTNLEMKKHKKMGFGMSVGGASGAVALNGELNLDPEHTISAGLGMGPNYGAFSLLYKHNYEGLYLSPYFKAGYSKWFSAGSTTTSFGNSDLLNQIYSEKQIKSGKFDTDFAVGSFGVEYNQLEGELSGINLFGELVLMTEIKTAKVVPTGSVGLIYFY